MMVEGKRTDLFRTDKKIYRGVLLLWWSIDWAVVLAIEGGPVRLAPVSVSVSYHHHRFSTVLGLPGLAAQAQYAPALEMLMMTRLSAQGLRDVSLFSCLCDA